MLPSKLKIFPVKPQGAIQEIKSFNDVWISNKNATF
jgi:hypothetical protein